MSPRFSLRAQIAVALAFALLLGGALNGVASFALTRKATRVNEKAMTRAFAIELDEACAGAAQGCFERAAAEASTGELRLAVRPDAALSAAERQTAAPLADGRRLVLQVAGSAHRLENVAALLVSYLLLDGLLVFIVGFFLLNRTVARPVDRLADAAERIGRLELDDPLGQRGPLLGRLGLAFERMSTNLKEERARVSAQIEQLQRLNRQLAEAKDSLVRSEKLATTGRLAAGVAHEIGNPLGAILGYLELAKSRTPPESREFLERIDGEIARIDRTVRELLDFSRPAEQKLEPLGLAAAVDGAVRLASVQKRLKHVEFDVEVPDDLRVMAENHHLSQVLVNVLLNAGDAMKGEGRIVVRAGRVDSPVSGPRVELSLRDSGPGIAPADLQRIFDPFFTTKDPGEGTGLGLAICHRILESFGGEIRAENAPEGGAVFTLAMVEAAG